MSLIADKLDEKERIADHIFKYVEKELYSYRTYKAAIVQLEQDMKEIVKYTPQASSDYIPARTGPGDPVSLSALRAVIIEEKIRENLRHIRKIEAGLELLKPEERELVDRKYFSGMEYANEQLIIQFHFNRNYFYKLRNEIIYTFAVMFGVL